MALSLPNSAALVLLSAAALTTWYFSRPPAAPPQARPASSSTAGYSLHGARFEGTDETGRIAYRLHAATLEEQPDTARLSMTDVHVDYGAPGAAAWSISAARATGPKDGSRLELSGDVELHADASDGKPALTIRSSAVSFVPQASRVESTAPVQLELGSWHVDAVGLDVHLKDRKVELESDVHGKFAR